ncbi:MAG TPA: radical SAM protein [Syntrophales bacterium]|nr:radical SAM protein [Syntrophales bacterium]
MQIPTAPGAHLVLIHPPVSKPCEPPAGIARLAGYLEAQGVSCDLIDANSEGFRFLFGPALRFEEVGSPGRRGMYPAAEGRSERVKAPGETTAERNLTNLDTWTRRAMRNLDRHLRDLRSSPLYSQPDRYRRAIADLGRILACLPYRREVVLGLADYQDGELSPVRSRDLLAAAGHPEKNPFYPYFISGLAPRLAVVAPPLAIGISLNYLSQALCAFAMIGFLRTRHPQTRIVLGGGLVTSWLRRPHARDPFDGLVDNLVAGPGEEFLLNLAKNCGSGIREGGHHSGGGEIWDTMVSRDDNRKPAARSIQAPAYDMTVVHDTTAIHSDLVSHDAPVSRVCWSDNGAASGRAGLADNGPGPGWTGAEARPEVVSSCPDYRAFPGELYLAPGPILPYSAAAGCWWRRCRFCPETAERNPYRPLPAEKVFADLDRLTKEMNPALIHFLDNAMSPALLAALARHPVGVPWYGFARITEQLAAPKFCRRLRDSGCIMLKLGLESGDQRVLDALDKGIDLKTASRVLWSLKAAGIAAYVYLLFGTPAEDREAARRTVEFVAAHSTAIGFLNIALFNLPAFAAAVSGLATRTFSDGDLSLYVDFDHPRGWSRREVRRFLAGEVKRHPAIAAILRRTPPVFTSNHAPFTAMGGGSFTPSS